MDQEKRAERKKNITQFCKNALFHNLLIKVLSIVCAVVVWLLIMNVSDPYKTKAFLVQVDLINEDAITEVNKVYEVTEGSTASVTVRGKRSVVDNLSSDDISATADLSDLSAVNAVAIQVSLKKSYSSDVTLTCSQVLKVSLEDLETTQVKVTVDTEGTPADGYLVGECTARPNVIEVSGGSSVIDRISTVRVTLNVNGASQTFSKYLEPAAYDQRGNKITSSTLSFSESSVKVKAKLLQTKTIPVSVEISGTPATGYEYVDVSCLPEEIEIAGTLDDLASVSEIVIPIDITGLTGSSEFLEQEIDVSDYLPEDITVGEAYQTVSVQITLEKLLQRTFTLSADAIEFKNVNDKYTASLYNTDETIKVTVMGRQSVLEELAKSTLSGHVNCAGLSAGVHKLRLKLDLDSSVTQLQNVHVKVLLEKKAKEEATASPDAAEPTQTPDAAAEEETASPETDAQETQESE